jgi:hypothetical protein
MYPIYEWTYGIEAFKSDQKKKMANAWKHRKQKSKKDLRKA